MSNKQYDVIVFGATSFVGEILSQYLLDTYGADQDLKWAISGRSEAKLNELKKTLGSSTDALDTIIANADSEQDMKALCDQCKVIISTVGPYALYGSPLVKACVDTGTDYCDLTGEAQWISAMIKEHEEAAKVSGARIVHCCGFDSIPSDMGVYHLQQLAKEELGEYCNTVTMRVKAAKGGASGGTIASMLNLVKEASKDAELRKELQNPYSLCPEGSKRNRDQKSINSAKYDNTAEGWIAPFVMAAINERIVLRSNALNNYADDFLYNEAMLTGKGAKGAVASNGILVGMGLFMASVVIPPLRWGLEKYVLPKPGEGPSPEAQLNGYFDLRFFGTTPAGKSIQTKVTGDRDPGYGSTGKMLGEAGLSLAFDISKEEKAGGFWTSASIFDQRLIDRLEQKAGLTFVSL